MINNKKVMTVSKYDGFIKMDFILVMFYKDGFLF
jgi:hypothetical protein